MNIENIVKAKPTPDLLRKRLKNGGYRIEEDGLYKRCTTCRDYWPADSEFFFSSVSDTDGLNCYCKACYLERRYPNGRSMKQIRQSAKDNYNAGYLSAVAMMTR